MKLADNFIERLTEHNIFFGFDKNQKSQDDTGFEVADVGLLSGDDAKRVAEHIRQKLVNVKYYKGKISENNTQLIDICTEIVKQYPGLAWTCKDVVEGVVEMVKPEDGFALNNKALEFYNAMKRDRNCEKDASVYCYSYRKTVFEELAGRLTVSGLRDEGVDNLFKEGLAETLCIEDRGLSEKFISHMEKVVNVAKSKGIQLSSANAGVVNVCSRIVDNHPELTKFCNGLVDRFAEVVDVEKDSTMKQSLDAYHNKPKEVRTSDVKIFPFVPQGVRG
jgi:hypothetical protein